MADRRRAGGRPSTGSQIDPDELARLLENRERAMHDAARQLHDEIGQSLSAAGLQLELIRLDFQTLSSDIPPRVAEIQHTLDIAMASARALSRSLDPWPFERLALPAALQRLIGQFAEKSSCDIEFHSDDGITVPKIHAKALFKTAEYSLRAAKTVNCVSGISIGLHRSGGGAELNILLRDLRNLLASRHLVCSTDFALARFYAAEAGRIINVVTDSKKGTIVSTSPNN